LTSKEDSLFFI